MVNRNEEEVILPRIKRSFREWEQSFKTMREQSSSERAWSEWLDALEIFWWLGHRKEAWEIAGEVRDFSFDGDRNRLLSVQRWNPESEKLVYIVLGTLKKYLTSISATFRIQTLAIMSIQGSAIRRTHMSISAKCQLEHVSHEESEA